MAQKPTHLAVGHVSRAHGTRGEVVVSPLTDHPGSVFAPGVVLHAAAAEGEAPDPDFPPLRVDTVRPFQDGYLVRFGGFEDRSAAEHLRRRYLVLPISELPAPDEGEWFYHELIGLTVRTLDGNEVGVVREVYEVEPAWLLEVRGAERTVLIPLAERIVREVDTAQGWMVIDPPEGLLDL